MPQVKRFRQVVCWAFLAFMASLVPLHFWLLDGLDGLLFSLGSDISTVYAPGYSDHAFRRVRVGMSSNEVVALLGPPLVVTIHTDGREGWAYSDKERDTSHFQRGVSFRNGVVCSKNSSYYMD